MKYETPELVVLSVANDAIQSGKGNPPTPDSQKDASPAYEDWE